MCIIIGMGIKITLKEVNKIRSNHHSYTNTANHLDWTTFHTTTWIITTLPITITITHKYLTSPIITTTLLMRVNNKYQW